MIHELIINYKTTDYAAVITKGKKSESKKRKNPLDKVVVNSNSTVHVYPSPIAIELPPQPMLKVNSAGTVTGSNVMIPQVQMEEESTDTDPDSRFGNITPLTPLTPITTNPKGIVLIKRLNYSEANEEWKQSDNVEEEEMVLQVYDRLLSNISARSEGGGDNIALRALPVAAETPTMRQEDGPISPVTVALPMSTQQSTSTCL